ncbi:hypothetical protein K443DRAFT_431376 [Laccaria amethystina LaAM-08-1]|uniref:Uncharacterized protein n=1 Tax=Laccaria amethystina LaAM-08-1 TaxID=1095629 RepID=A0A0C9WWT7_9AGAR|nr:hypothetical protein K443DRAFT_431376 [Laccaria amethystina LaAM-08-1]
MQLFQGINEVLRRKGTNNKKSNSFFRISQGTSGGMSSESQSLLLSPFLYFDAEPS